jgi:hypothetical protein
MGKPIWNDIALAAGAALAVLVSTSFLLFCFSRAAL